MNSTTFEIELTPDQKRKLDAFILDLTYYQRRGLPEPQSQPIPDDPSHFGGEIGDKIPFGGLKGLNRKETATKVLTIPKTGTWWVGGTLLRLNKGDEIAWIDGGYSDEL